MNYKQSEHNERIKGLQNTCMHDYENAQFAALFLPHHAAQYQREAAAMYKRVQAAMGIQDDTPDAPR